MEYTAIYVVWALAFFYAFFLDNYVSLCVNVGNCGDS